MSQLLPSRDEENAMWSRLEQRRQMRQAAAVRVTPQGAQNLAAMQRAHPTVATGTKVALAQAGVQPDDPIMAQVVPADQRVKRKKGFGFHTIGDVVKAGLSPIGKGLELAGDVVSPIGEAVSGVARPVVRTGLMALSAPFEEAGGVLRNVASGLPGRSGEITAGVGGGAAAGAAIGGALGAIGGPLAAVTAGAGALVGGAIGGIAGALAPEVEGTPQWGPQSQLGIAATQLAAGQKVEAGSGWFANTETGLGQEQKRRAIAAAGIRNKRGEITSGWTIGRSIADVVAEPGTTPYNILSGLIDAPAAVKLDPSAAALKGRTLSPTLRALKKDGLIDGARKTILPEKVADLLDHSAFGQKLKETVAAEGNTYRISKLFNGQLDNNPAALAALANTTTEDEAALVLRGVLGADVATVPKTELSKRRVTRLIPGAPDEAALAHRQRVEIGHRRIEWDDPSGAIKALDSFQAMAKVPEAERLANNDMFIRALSGPSTGRLPALEATASSVKSALVAGGADDATARTLSTLFQSSIEDARQFTAGTITGDDLLPGLVINGDGVGIKSPFLYNEFLSHGVTLPDPRELSDAVRWIKTLNHPLAKGTTATVDKAFGLWRSAAVLRPAYFLRVGGESQARMAGADYKSLLNHPIDYIMRLVTDKKGNSMPDLTGSPLVDNEIIQGGLNRTRGSQVGRTPGVTMKDRARLTVARDDPKLVRNAWRDHELSRLHHDPLGRQLARLRRTGNSAALDDEIPEVATFDSFDEGVRTAVLDATGRGPNYQSVDDLKQSFWDGPLSGLRRDLQKMDEDAPILASRETSDAYVDQINQWLDDFTRNDDRLLEFVHRGPRVNTNRRASEAIDELIETGNHPAMVVGSRTLIDEAADRSHYDRFVDTMFDWIATRPENRFAREPVLGEAYWRAVERMLPALDDADKAWAIKLAEDAKAPDVVKRLQDRAKVAFDGERLPKEQVNLVAAHEAADAAKKMFYDMATKAKWADAMRLVFPFAEPWKEALTVWGRILQDNPAVVRRLDQTIQGARGSGFFQKDPATGEEMFVYPGSAFISKTLVGAPIPIKGSVAGLNLFGSNPVMPGFGPAVQVAANALLPDKPDYDWIRSTISPYGRTDTSEGFVESFLPPWFQKFRQALTSGENDRLFNNTVYDMARYLVSTGDYSIDTPEAQEETTQAAISMAKRMYLLRTGASLISPSAPSPQMVAEDRDGRVVTQFLLMEEYRALQQDAGTKTKVGSRDIEGVGYENAVEEFMNRYGQGALLLMQPKTKGGAAPLDDTMDWIRDNPGLAKRYDEVYQYFAPHSGEFSQTAYERELATGERKPLTPKEAMEAANSRVASMLMREARAKTGTRISDAERRWLADVQAALIEEYPGYNPQSFDAGRVPAAIRQLEDALAEPKMADTKNGKAISLYLQARAKAQEAAEAAGVAGFQKAKKMRGTRDWLRAVAAAITEETPEFSTVWDQLLSRELTSDIEQTTTV